MREIKKPISEIFTEAGVAFSETRTGEIVLDRCFNCGRPKKMYVHLDSGAFICFRCDIRGGPVKLIKETLNCSFKQAFDVVFGKQAPESVYSEENDFDLQVCLTGIKKNRKSKVDLPKPMVKPHYLQKLKKSDTDAWNYLKKRGLTDETIKELDFYHWESAKRVVLPITIDGKLYGTLSRDYIGDQERKVLNSTGNWRSYTVWNYDIARDSDQLVICEGAFSAIKCGMYRSVALFGKSITDGQVEIIRSTNAKKIYICLDVGTDDEQLKIFRSLGIYFPGSIFRINLPPIIENKNKTTGTDELASKINVVFDTNVSFHKETSFDGIKFKDVYFFTPDDKNKILDTCGVSGRDSVDIKIKKIKKFCLVSKKIKFSDKDINEFIWLLLKSEYKDPGDYDFSEMESLISSAEPFRGGPTNW